MVRAKRSKKSSRFNINLGDEEDKLTHYGQSLSVIEKFEKPVADDAFGSEALEAEFVSQAHFGGLPDDNPNPNLISVKKPGDDVFKRKMMLQDLIKSSKREKAERQVVRDEAMEKTDELDEQWKTMTTNPVLRQLFRPDQDSKGKNLDEFDSLVKELQFEGRSVRATDKLDAPEAIVIKEKERLVKLEEERLARMKGAIIAKLKDNVESNVASSSAKRTVSDRLQVAYSSDGKLIGTSGSEEMKHHGGSYSEGSSGEEESDEDDSDDEDENSDENGAAESETDVAGGANEEGFLAPMVDCSDLESGSEELLEQLETGQHYFSVDSSKRNLGRTSALSPTSDTEVPYVLPMPCSYGDFLTVITSMSHLKSDNLASGKRELKTPAYIGTVVERLVKLYHPSLAEGNKAALGRLYCFLLRLFDDVITEAGAAASTSDNPSADVEVRKKRFNITGPTAAATSSSLAAQYVDILTKGLYRVLQLAPSKKCALATRLMIKRYTRAAFPKPNSSARLGAKHFYFLKILPSLYPASDAWHPVMSPAFLLLMRLISSSRPKTATDLSRMLSFVPVAFEYISDSKRYVPELIHILTAALQASLPPSASLSAYLGISLMSSSSTKIGCILEISEPVDGGKKIPGLAVPKLFGLTPDTDFNQELQKLSCIQLSVACLRTLFLRLWADVPSFSTIFEPASRILTQVPKQNFPASLVTTIEDTMRQLDRDIAAKATQPYLDRSAARAKSKAKKQTFKFLEPRVETNFNPDRKQRSGGPAKPGTKAETKKLESQYKRELKGTVRELKRDGQYLARARLEQQEAADAIRQAKTKRLMASLMGQEGDYKKAKRAKEIAD